MTTATAKAPDIAPGVLALHELGPAPDARRALALGRIGRHGTSDALIPPGLFDQLDHARGRFLALRSSLGRRIEALVAQRRVYRVEDAEHQAHIERVARIIEDAAPATEDARTPTAEREQTLAALHAEAWASAIALADELSDVISLVRHNERGWLADLQGRLPAVRHKQAEAARLLEQAELEERRLAGIGRWVMAFADDTALGVAPPVEPQVVPGARGHAPAEASLQRPYTRGADWNEGEGVAERPMRRQPTPSDEPTEDDAPGLRNLGAGVGLVLGE